MMGRTHEVGGICVGAIATAWLFNAPEFAAQAAIAAPLLIYTARFGSLLPDIDHPRSMFGRKVKPLSEYLYKTYGHRKITHTLLSLVAVSFLFSALAYFLPASIDVYGYAITVQLYGWVAALGMTIGYASHLFLDMLTPMGIPLFDPFTKKSIRLAKLTTGKYDDYVGIVMVIGTMWTVYKIAPFF